MLYQLPKFDMVECLTYFCYAKGGDLVCCQMFLTQLQPAYFFRRQIFYLGSELHGFSHKRISRYSLTMDCIWKRSA